MRESEICPLFFLYNEGTLQVVTDKGRSFPLPVESEIEDQGYVCILDIAALRNYFVETYDEKPMQLNIMQDGGYTFHIKIVPSAPARHHLVIEFVNSFSVPERLEISGKLVAEPELEEATPFGVYEDIIAGFSEQNERIELREVIFANAGWKTPEDFMFLRDMLQSDRHTLIDKGNRFSCRVLPENISHEFFPTAPGSIQLHIRLSDADRSYSPKWDDSDAVYHYGEAIWPRGFTDAGGFLYEESDLNNYPD
jgi:hypothetical protein